MNFCRRNALLLGVAALSALTPFSQAAHAQTAGYPSKPIKLVMPSAPGGTGDRLARAIADRMQEKLKQPVLFDYRLGSGSNIGMEFAAKADPDGYTLLFAGTPLAVNPSLYKKMPFDTARLTPISMVSLSPYVMVVHTGLPVKNIAEFLAYARANPNKLSYASPGMGSGAHLAGSLMNELANIDMRHIPYKSSPQVLTDVIGGSADVTFTPLITGASLIKAGKLRAIAVTGAQRSSAMPDIPTVSEAGLPNYEISGWYGIMAPTGTPEPILDMLNKIIVDALRDPELVKSFAIDGLNLVPSRRDEFAKFLKDAQVSAARIVRRSGASLD
ncbi:MAG: tripartite tricarboxylate transporter substrate binding protein [Pseudomonadota bacterium]